MISQVTLESFYSIAGRVVHISAEDEWSAAAVSELLARCFFERNSLLKGEQPGIKLRVMCTTPPPVPRGLDGFEVLGGNCATDGQSLYLEIDDSLVVVGPGAPPQIEIWFREEYEFDSSVLANIFWQALGAALRRCGLFELHSGGVVFPGSDRALLICGPSGSGKSTITWQLAARGWYYLSDDRLLLQESRNTIQALPVRRFFALTADSIAAAGMNSTTELAGSQKQRFTPQDFFPGKQVRSAVPATIVFPVITHEATSRAQQLSDTETMLRFLRICPWACYDKPIAGAHLKLLQRFARDTVGFDLFAGMDLLQDSERTARMVSDLNPRT